MAGIVKVWQARKVAQAVLGERNDVCAYVDGKLVERLRTRGSIGTIVVERLVDEAMLRLHAEERELKQIEALDRRHVTVDRGLDQPPRHRRPRRPSRLGGPVRVRRHRRSRRRGAQAAPRVPARVPRRHAARSLSGSSPTPPARRRSSTDTHRASPPRRRRARGHLHLTEDNVFFHDGVVTDADAQSPPRRRSSWAWVGRHDIALTRRGPALRRSRRRLRRLPRSHRLRQPLGPRARGLRPLHSWTEHIVERPNKTCVHPHCTRPARRCDCDHVKAFDAGGVTCPKCNLAPLCRHHHRLKTHADWRYWKLAPDTYLWVDPHGLMYLRTGEVTRQLDDGPSST